MIHPDYDLPHGSNVNLYSAQMRGLSRDWVEVPENPENTAVRPALFQVRCKLPRQIELGKAFCHYI
jgi:hypothetical protein